MVLGVSMDWVVLGVSIDCVIMKFPFCGSVFVFDFMSIQFFNHFKEEEKAGCFDCNVLRMYCYCKSSVTLPHGAVGWSAVCDCGISSSSCDHTHLLFNRLGGLGCFSRQCDLRCFNILFDFGCFNELCDLVCFR